MHIHNISQLNELNKDQRILFKRRFIERYVPQKYLKFIDKSLCGIHMIALEHKEHWKYGSIKKLMAKFNPLEDLQGEANHRKNGKRY